ncbi:MAG: hypothetical protein QM652_06230 [Legionella sp.]|uniref:hypothetical protein n=1 Tax=Legionella sp. TaxID=459 RepID=UPI0039E5B26E
MKPHTPLFFQEELINRTTKLLDSYVNVEGTLRERVFLAYATKTLNELKKLAQGNADDLANKLEKYLKQHWERINGTFVSYSSIPENEVTHLLLDAAIFTAQQLNENTRKKSPVGAINVLMSTVNTVSLSEQWPHLGAYEDDAYKNQVNIDLDLQLLLKTHILGQKGFYLIPVQLLPTLLEEEKKETRYNPYYNYKDHSENMATINEEEMHRLIDHSNRSRALYEAYQRYQSYVKDQNHLLGHLTLLCKALYMNSVSGLGREDNAGSGVYPAILSFRDYYHTLDEELSKKIPAEVKKEIDTLLDFAFNKEANKNATETLATCIATRRTLLLKAIENNEVSLSQIIVSGSTHENLLHTAKTTYEQAKEDLIQSIKQGNYSGHDMVGLTKDLLTWLDIPFSITSRQDLADLTNLSAEEIKNLGALEKLGQQIAAQFINLEEFIWFAVDTKPEILGAIITISAPELQKSILSRFNNVAQLLLPLEKDHRLAILKSLKDQLPKCIKNASDFSTAFQLLDVEHPTILLEALKNHSREFIKNVSDFSTVFQLLNTERRAILFEALKNHLPEFIKNASDFNSVFQLLSTEQRTILLEAFKNHSSEFIREVDDFSTVFQLLDTEQRTIFFDILKDQSFNFIHNSFALSTVIRYLNEEQFKWICNNILQDIIISAHDIKEFCLFDSKKFAMIWNELKRYFSTLINNIDDVEEVLCQLNIEQFTIVCNELKDRLPSIITHANKFKSLLKKCNEQQRAILFEVLKDHLPSLIKTPLQFKWALENLDIEQRAVLFDMCKDRLLQMIRNSFEFQDATAYLNVEQVIVICTALKDRLPQLITNEEDFNKLTSEQREAITKVDKNRFFQPASKVESEIKSPIAKIDPLG